MAQARAARMRAPATRAPSRGGGGGAGSGPSRTAKQGQSTQQGAAGTQSTTDTSEFDAVLDLQEAVGNRAVVQLLGGGAAPAAPPPGGFNGAGNNAFGRIVAGRFPRAIQREMAPGTDPKLRAQYLRDSIRFEPLFYRFVIDLDKTADALANLTADEGRTVKDLFRQWKGWNLGWVLSAVETPISDGPPAPNNLSQANRTRLLNLLAGTVVKPEEPAPPPAPATAPAPTDGASGPAAAAGGPAVPAGGPAAPAAPASAPAPNPDKERVAKNRLRVIASSIRAAVAKKDVAAATALIPPSMEERRAVDDVYKAFYGETAYMALFTKLPGKHGQRAAALWYDERDDADRLALEAAADERDKANKEAAEIEKVGIFAPVAKARRKEGQEKVEAAVKQVAQSGDQSTVKGREAGRERLQKALNDPKGGLAKKIDTRSDGITKAIAEGDEAAELAGRLARADETTDVSAAEVESALRSLNELATAAADREIDADPEKLEPVAAQVTKNRIDDYYDRFVKAFNSQQNRRTFDLVVTGHGGTDEKVAKSVGVSVDDMREVAGKSSDIYRNKQLLANKGVLPEWQEVFYALNRDPKDIERVRSILSAKTYTEVQILAYEYMTHTGLRSLEVDLAGTDAEQTFAKVMGGEVKEGLDDRRALLAGGKFDRDAAEARVPAGLDPDERAAHLLKAEGAFLSGKITALERRVIENRGYFAKVRDWSGNEEKSILDLASKDALRAQSGLANALTPDRGPTWKPGEEGTPLRPNIAEAKRQVMELRRIEARMNHAVSIYKEATKKAYEEFVELVVNAATIAAGLGVTGIWLTALRTTAATVGTKLLMKGNDYSVDEFLGDIQGGMAGVAGDFAKLGFKQFVAPYVASKILRNARRLGMSKAFIAKVEAQVGPLAMRQAEHTIGTGVSNVAQGRSVLEGQGLGERVKGEVIGQVTGPIDQRIKMRKEAAAIVKRARAGEAEEPETGSPRRTDEDDAATRRTAAGTGGTETGAGDASATAATPQAGDDAAGPAAAAEPATPHVSMALPDAPSRVGKPAPQTEAPPARPTAPGATGGSAHMDPPRTDGADPAMDRPAKRGRPAPEPAAPRAMTADGQPGGAAKALEYPPGAVQLNAPGGAGAQAASVHPATGDLAAQPRSDRFQRQSNERLRKAEQQMRVVNELGETGGLMHDTALKDLREAQSDYDVAHGKRPATLHELQRIADDDVAEAELDYAIAKDSETWKAREKAEREHAAAVEEQRRAKSAAAAAHAWALNVQNRDTDPTTRQAAFDAYDAATARLKAADQAVAPAAARRERAAAADWTSRRAWSALRMAREQRSRAAGRSTPPPTPGVRKAGGPVHGPATPLEEGPGPRRFTPELWDKELVIQLKDTTSLREHEQLVFNMLREDPTREVGLFRNSKTGEWIVVRGKKMTVVVESDPGSGDEKGGSGPKGEGQRQRWKELLAKGSDVGEWELIAHSHPSEKGQLVSRIAQYPSGYTGDFSVLRSEAMRDGRPKSSAIYYMDGDIRQKTTFGYDPKKVFPYWIQLPGEPPVHFQSIENYHKYLVDQLAPYGIRPDLPEIPQDHWEEIGSED